jgi:hypothetical protein
VCFDGGRFPQTAAFLDLPLAVKSRPSFSHLLFFGLIMVRVNPVNVVHSMPDILSVSFMSFASMRLTACWWSPFYLCPELTFLCIKVLLLKDSMSVRYPPRTLFTRVNFPQLKCTTITTISTMFCIDLTSPSFTLDSRPTPSQVGIGLSL